MQFGEWLQGQRKARGWSFKQMADRMAATGLTKASAPYVQQVERGEINPKKIGRDKLEAFAQVLDLSVDELLIAAKIATMASPSPAQVAAYLARLKALGVSENILTQLAARSEYLSDQDWQNFVTLAARGQEEDRSQQPARAQTQEGRGEGATHEGGQVEAHHAPPHTAHVTS